MKNKRYIITFLVLLILIGGALFGFKKINQNRQALVTNSQSKNQVAPDLSAQTQKDEVVPKKKIDKDTTAFRERVMNYLASNLKTFSPVKGEWDLYGFWWPNNEYVSVEYYKKKDDSVQNQDEPLIDEGYTLLFKVEEKNGKIIAEKTAFEKVDLNGVWQTLEGADPFKDSEDLDLYVKNKKGKWALADMGDLQ